jgi:prevent-host-death family protein
MKSMPVGEFKTKFSQVIERVKKGEKVAISYGKKKENIAVIVPYAEYKRTSAIKLGLLKGKASYAFKKDFSMTFEELVGS